METSPASLWSPPPEIVFLQDDEVHVWKASLKPEGSSVQSLRLTLSPDERARAGRFYFQKDREHFVVARGLLRVILGRYLNREPGQLQFRYNPYGKPALVNHTGKSEICFNVSHSQELALYAITRGREIGVDIERIRPDMVEDQIAERFFSPREVRALRSLPPSSQPVGFFNCWTRKEAYIKARGKGLSFPLDQFDVSLAPGEPTALLHVSADPEEPSRWSLRELAPGSGYAGAVIAEGQDWRLHCWQWPDKFEPSLGGDSGSPSPL
jgi:4'-phosphopantetheinyl transferase